jgi:gelsolin
VWRIEKFQVKEWPADHYGEFYSGDSYIVLNTYKEPGKPGWGLSRSFVFARAEFTLALKWNVHFWLGAHTTQDEAGTAAYKTVELDDHLGGAPVEYREVRVLRCECVRAP